MGEKLKGRVALVTGGNRGIGRAIAESLAGEGAAVAVAGRRLETLQQTAEAIRKEGGRAAVVQGDVARCADAENMVAETVEQLGRLDILVNNAGVLLLGSILDTTEEIWDDTFAVNLKGAFFVTRAAVPHMQRQKKGKVINISSIGGPSLAFPNGSAYCASKAGMVGLTYALAAELGPQGINVNAINPGDIETDMNRHLLADAEYRRGRLAMIPCGRLGRVSDIGPAALFLASDDADYVNGAVLYIDGGMRIV